MLCGEIELSKLAHEVSALQRAVFDSNKIDAQADEFATAREEEIDQCTRQQAELAGQFSTASNITLRNNIILQANSLISRLKQLHASCAAP